MSFDYSDGIPSLASVYAAIKSLNASAVTPWTVIFEKTSGSSSLNTTSGVENITDKWIAFKSKATGNNVGSEDVKFTYFIVQLDVTNSRLVFRTASSVTNAGVTVDVTPLSSAVKISSVSFPQVCGVVVDQNQFAVMIKDGVNASYFACVAQLTGLITSGVDMDYRFCLLGSNTGCWALPTTLYPAGDYQLKSAVTPIGLNSQINGFHLFPLAVYDSIAGDTFIGYIQDLHLIEDTSVQPMDIIDNNINWYRAARKNADDSFVLIKEGVSQ